MTKKLMRGRGFGARQDKDDEQELQALLAYGKLAVEIGLDGNTGRFAKRLRETIRDRVERFGGREWRYATNWLVDVVVSQHDHTPMPTRYEGNDPLSAKVTWISYAISFNRDDNQVAAYKQNGIPYPASLDEAIDEVLPQFIFAVESGPTPEDFKNQQVDGFTTENMMAMLADLWHYRRLSPEEYEDRRKELFAEHWRRIKPDVVETMKEQNRRMKHEQIEPTDSEISLRRREIRDQYRQAIRQTFERTEKRLSAKRGNMVFRRE